MNVTADVTWNLGGASLFGAIYYSNADTKWSRLSLPQGGGNGAPTVNGTTRLLGLVVQGSVYLTEKWEVYGRYQFLDPLSAPETEPPGPNAVPATFSSLNAINLPIDMLQLPTRVTTLTGTIFTSTNNTTCGYTKTRGCEKRKTLLR